MLNDEMKYEEMRGKKETKRSKKWYERDIWKKVDCLVDYGS